MKIVDKQKKEAFTLIEIMVAIGILFILVTLVIPNVIRSRVTAQDVLAQNTLSVMSKASEIYLAMSDGVYPATIHSLTSAVPPYLSYNYCGTDSAGFTYDCVNAITGYTYTATPVSLGVTGSTIFSISSGGVKSPSGWGGGGSSSLP